MLDEIVMEWEDRFNEWLGDVQDRMAADQAGEEEVRQLKRLEHTVLIYDLMMGSIIENQGCGGGIASDVSDMVALQSLADTVEGAVSCSHEQLYETLVFAMAGGDLKRFDQDGKVCWEWVSYL